MSKLSSDELAKATRSTIGHYQDSANRFWEGTRDHDVSQNIDALIAAVRKPAPLRILDFGCGPGRDLKTLRDAGHEPIGLDGTLKFVEMARAYAGVPVLHQDFLDLELSPDHFDGVFANASLFHVPRQEIGRVLVALHDALRPGGVLFASNPRGENEEGWQGARFGSYHDFEAWSGFVLGAGFEEIRHYYRPPGKPRAEQPWLATLWRRPTAAG